MNLNSKKCHFVLLYSLIALVLLYICHSIYLVSYYKNEISLLKTSIHKKNIFITELSGSKSSSKYFQATSFEKKDWQDHKFIKYEAAREGPGEQGKPFQLTDPNDIALNENLFKIQGLFVVVSDKISVNRSVPDVRINECKAKQYLAQLPNVSVVVIFHNEYPYESILYRTLHSIFNRTPRELLHEIVLVNDGSSEELLYEPLQKYVAEHFHGVVKVLNLQNRMGLIVARMEGAKIATGVVLVFLDAHIEVNVNWLPPLLEPIAIDPLTATSPIVDNFKHDTFEYSKGGDGSRGVFDLHTWIYKWLPLRKQDKVKPDEPHDLPVMLGCAFAINRKYYWDLGGYDEELLIWNGENYELSFKLWLCGGSLLEVPCSRVAHTFRKHNEYRKKPGVDFVARNFKRIAEVWLDEYKEYLYANEPKRYAKIDPGDLTKPRAIKQKLNCKPFKYFLEFVMPDVLDRYPISDPGVFASGVIKSEADPDLCVEKLPGIGPLELKKCSSNLVHPDSSQYYSLSWHRNIKKHSTDDCLDSYETSLLGCHYTPSGNQFWRYKAENHFIINGKSDGTSCLTAVIETKKLEMKDCEVSNVNQKWTWGYINHTALQHWYTFGANFE